MHPPFKVKQIEVEQLAQLERLAVLDLQNNAIDHVPPQLGNLTQIRALQLEVSNIANINKTALQQVSKIRSVILDKQYNLY